MRRLILLLLSKDNFHKYFTLNPASFLSALNSSSPVTKVAFCLIVSAAAKASAYEMEYFAFSLAAANVKSRSALII